MEGLKNKGISVVFVYFNGTLLFLKSIDILLKIFRIRNNIVIVNNSKNNINSKYKTIKGSNTCQDFSGFLEGVKYLESKNEVGAYTIFFNDTVDKRRFSYGSRLFNVIYNSIRVVYSKKNVNLIGELTGKGINEIIYGIPIIQTYSSYLFFCKTNIFINFMNDYYTKICHNTVILNGSISSIHQDISLNYQLSLNGFLGLNGENAFGFWYNYKNASLDTKLTKAKCLILERMLPSYCMKKGIVIDFYKSFFMRLIRSFESQIYKLWS